METAVTLFLKDNFQFLKGIGKSKERQYAKCVEAGPGPSKDTKPGPNLITMLLAQVGKNTHF